MKTRFTTTTLRLFLILIILIFLTACSEGTGSESEEEAPEPSTESDIAQIFVEVDPNAINVGGSTTVTAYAYDTSGNGVSDVYLTFGLDQPFLASFDGYLQRTDANGMAQTRLVARDKIGNLNVWASTDSLDSDTAEITIMSGVSPNAINVSANPSSLLIRETATVTAEVLDEEGLPVPDGTAVSFSVPTTSYGEMSSTSETTINGFASSTFVASETPGTATVEVSVGAINNSIDILINSTQPAALEFVSADPQRISLKGSGGNENSDIQFRVVDGDGVGVGGTSVRVNIEKGPNGGEYIDDDEDEDVIYVGSDTDGLVTVTLRSGTIPGAVTLKGSIEVDGVTFTTNASVVSIGGGVPTSSRFSVSADPLNIPGLDRNGEPTTITAWMSDRYGNYNILEGTTVSFWSETAVSINASEATVDEDGIASVSARTQHPARAYSTGGMDVEPWQWEEDLAAYLWSTYGLASPTGTHPRDGQVSVLAITQGEEYFRDENADGYYTAGEMYDDTHDDPFIDINDNDTRDDGTGVDPFEEYSDSNETLGWQSKNGQWDSQKDIFTSAKLLVTGEPIIAVDPSLPGFDISNGGSLDGTFIVCDRNLNYMSGGTTISVSIEGGGKVYADNIEMPDMSGLPGSEDGYAGHLANIEFGMTIVDDAADEIKTRSVAVTITVDWVYGSESLTFTGTID
jgi:hypothetical protein